MTAQEYWQKCEKRLAGETISSETAFYVGIISAMDFILGGPTSRMSARMGKLLDELEARLPDEVKRKLKL